jgi:hypothetical protein
MESPRATQSSPGSIVRPLTSRYSLPSFRPPCVLVTSMLWTLLAARTNPSGHCSEGSAKRTSSTHWCRAKRASTKASCRNLSCGRLNQSFEVHRAQKPSTAALNVSGLCHRARATRAASTSSGVNGVPDGSSSSSNSGLIGVILISLSFRSSSISSILLEQPPKRWIRLHQLVSEIERDRKPACPFVGVTLASTRMIQLFINGSSRKTWMPGSSPGMTTERSRPSLSLHR